MNSFPWTSCTIGFLRCSVGDIASSLIRPRIRVREVAMVRCDGAKLRCDGAKKRRRDEAKKRWYDAMERRKEDAMKRRSDGTMRWSEEVKTRWSEEAKLQCDDITAIDKWCPEKSSLSWDVSFRMTVASSKNVHLSSKYNFYQSYKWHDHWALVI